MGKNIVEMSRIPVIVGAIVVAIGVDTIGRFEDRVRGRYLLLLRGYGGQWRIGTKNRFSNKRCSRCVG